MSHWTTIKTEIRDPEATRAACRELGLPIAFAIAGQKLKARGYGGNTVECDAVITLKGPYDVALIRQPNGAYAVQADYWNGRVASEVGENCGRLIQLYGIHRATLEARKLGHNVRRVAMPNGAVNLHISGVRL